jgi:hypothetical protein
MGVVAAMQSDPTLEWKVSAVTFVAIVISYLPQEGILFVVFYVPYLQIGRRFFRHQRPYWIVGGLLVTLLAIVPAIAAVLFVYGAPSPANK